MARARRQAVAPAPEGRRGPCRRRRPARRRGSPSARPRERPSRPARGVPRRCPAPCRPRSGPRRRPPASPGRCTRTRGRRPTTARTGGRPSRTARAAGVVPSAADRADPAAGPFPGGRTAGLAWRDDGSPRYTAPVPRPPRPDDLYRLRVPIGVRLSPDGRSVVTSRQDGRARLRWLPPRPVDRPDRWRGAAPADDRREERLARPVVAGRTDARVSVRPTLDRRGGAGARVLHQATRGLGPGLPAAGRRRARPGA